MAALKSSRDSIYPKSPCQLVSNSEPVNARLILPRDSQGCCVAISSTDLSTKGHSCDLSHRCEHWLKNLS